MSWNPGNQQKCTSQISKPETIVHKSHNLTSDKNEAAKEKKVQAAVEPLSMVGCYIKLTILAKSFSAAHTNHHYKILISALGSNYKHNLKLIVFFKKKEFKIIQV
jgi:hypothetical protein